MSDSDSALQSGRGFAQALHKLGQLIPGYDGYQNRQRLREDDRALRSALALSLDKCLRLIKDLQEQTLESKGPEALGNLVNCERSAQLLSTSWRSAPAFYTAFNKESEFGRDQQQELISLDLECVDASRELAETLRLHAGDDLSLSSAFECLKRIRSLYERRCALLSGQVEA